VSVSSGVGPVELTDPKGLKHTTKEKYLHVTVRVRNIGFEKELPLSGWAAGQTVDGVRVTDANGKSLALATFETGGEPGRGKPVSRALPGHSSEVVLVYAAPPARTDFVRVQLAGAALGAQDEIKFRTGTAALLSRVPKH
jgi:hypothetical protein